LPDDSGITDCLRRILRRLPKALDALSAYGSGVENQGSIDAEFLAGLDVARKSLVKLGADADTLAAVRSLRRAYVEYSAAGVLAPMRLGGPLDLHARMRATEARQAVATAKLERARLRMEELVENARHGGPLPESSAALTAAGQAAPAGGRPGAADNLGRIRELEETTPEFNRQNGEWVKNTKAAELEGLEPRTLAAYRSQGIANADKTLGRERDGRVWRRPGTPNSHPWYLRSTLKNPGRINPKP